MDKKEILKNVQSYSADQLSEWIRQNVVTLDELRATGMLLKITERRITGILAKSPESSVDAFNRGKEQLSSVTSSVYLSEDDEEDTYAYDGEDYNSNSSSVSNASAASTLSDSDNSSAVSTPISNRGGMFNRPFSLKGRIRRSEYGLSVILYSVLAVILQTIMAAIVSSTPSDKSAAPVLILVLLLPYIMLWWFMVAQGAKRCHDMGHSGWYQLIPFYGLLMLFMNGDKGTNEYGDNPKGE